MAFSCGATLSADVRTRVRFADLRGGAGAFTYRVCSYARPLISYAGQESRFAAKKHNVELALSRIDALVVGPGETLSFWRAVGRPTTRAGYARAAALKDGVLVEDVGGAICLASTLLYNIGLLSGMQSKRDSATASTHTAMRATSSWVGTPRWSTRIATCICATCCVSSYGSVHPSRMAPSSPRRGRTVSSICARMSP